jgi:hypothetical protein
LRFYNYVFSKYLKPAFLAIKENVKDPKYQDEYWDKDAFL